MQVCNECNQESKFIVSIGDNFYCGLCLAGAYEFVVGQLEERDKQIEELQTIVRVGLEEQKRLREDMKVVEQLKELNEKDTN